MVGTVVSAIGVWRNSYFDVLLESLTNTTKRKVDKGSYLR